MSTFHLKFLLILLITVCVYCQQQQHLLFGLRGKLDLDSVNDFANVNEPENNSKENTIAENIPNGGETDSQNVIGIQSSSDPIRISFLLESIKEGDEVRFIESLHAEELNILKILLQSGGNPDITDLDGVTPLMEAARKADRDLVDCLLSNKANPLFLSRDGLSAFDFAMRSGRRLVAMMIAESAVLHAMTGTDNNIPVVMYYLRHGAYINIRNPAGWTPLIYITSFGDADAVRSVVEDFSDLNINLADLDGWTALHHAAFNGDLNLVHMLMLSPRLDLYLRTKNGETARSIALRRGFTVFSTVLPEGRGANGDEL